MSLAESRNRPSRDSEAATATTTTEPKRTLSAVPLIVVMCLQIVVCLAYTVLELTGAVR
jgi:hypothetical protein